eukprot:scaffold22348_cov101-Isochrysis_galbana.AAC.1
MPEGEVNVLGPPLGVGGRLEVEHDRHPGWDRVRDDRLGAARAGRRPEVVRAVRPQAVRREQAKRLSVCVRAVLGRVVAKGARLGERVGAAGRRQERLHVVQVQVGPRRVGRCELPHQRRRPCRAVDELVVVDVQQVGEAGGAGGRDGPGDVRRLPVHLLEVVALVGRREAGLHQGVPGGRRQQRLERGSVFDSDVEALHSKSLVVVRQPRLEVGRALDHRHHRHGHAVRDSGVAATVPVAHRRGRRPGAGRHDEDGVWVARLHVVGRSLGAKHGGRRVGAGRRVEQLRRRTVAPVMPEGVRELLRVLWRRVDAGPQPPQPQARRSPGTCNQTATSAARAGSARRQSEARRRASTRGTLASRPPQPRADSTPPSAAAGASGCQSCRPGCG